MMRRCDDVGRAPLIFRMFELNGWIDFIHRTYNTLQRDNGDDIRVCTHTRDWRQRTVIESRILRLISGILSAFSLRGEKAIGENDIHDALTVP